MVLKRTNWPIVRSPLITSRPPKKTTAAIEIVGRKNSAGRCCDSTPAWLITVSRTAFALPPKRLRTSSSRPNACTISMPTTASSAASVTSPLRACTCREIGITRWAKRHATNAISGVATPVYSVSRGLIDASTMAPPTIIMALCTPCTTPQPMK